MTVGNWYTQITDRLTKAGCDSPAFDAVCLLEDVGGVPRGQVSAASDRPLDAAVETALKAAVIRREQGYPLQYILGEWEFLSLRLKVGEGVLIPRPDTELLCETVADRLDRRFGNSPTKVLDLCAGSGCVGLGIASLHKGATPTLVEKSDAAFAYLTANVDRYPQFGGEAVKADIFTAPVPTAAYHALVSNPPYIPTADLAGLMREVQHEPQMALDGDADGLVFYRAIADRWLASLLPGGICAVEVGIGQAQDVAAIFKAAGLLDVEIKTDYGGVDRVVVGHI
ncbi:MAG: peptide chain release factor N(5)-glutamine methyltransferase [Ruminococcaceae bacterium]|nr:peptide chain release factor N(5)-glutamine methyltransferase [Oscillospiraceae bacterium]